MVVAPVVGAATETVVAEAAVAEVVGVVVEGEVMTILSKSQGLVLACIKANLRETSMSTKSFLRSQNLVI
jgi:hypothetical protein